LLSENEKLRAENTKLLETTKPPNKTLPPQLEVNEIHIGSNVSCSSSDSGSSPTLPQTSNPKPKRGGNKNENTKRINDHDRKMKRNNSAVEPLQTNGVQTNTGFPIVTSDSTTKIKKTNTEGEWITVPSKKKGRYSMVIA
jgi:hypothetical protein